jgi:hypothetical protein
MAKSVSRALPPPKTLRRQSFGEVGDVVEGGFWCSRVKK